ncbi:hypothetical protein L2784_08465 [Lactobacillus crispatus]|jgi:hypothetical protein|uniref:Uncharacterized protein n=3 Tax=Lactobacillus crispatus TaxID=47770 RepID=A0A4R6CPQ5_9LACO|nr:hypothetical protein [Lactobacillus crispatus]EKB62039.1 hypothetical protein HMPREF9249_02463 [Lactobacillus crispatus FB077-07]MBG0720044.1 hypothetical protein [Lactobacillus crispatus]MBI1711040.1 hypothetical protein [Lactobacillus crispatus]MCT7777062.1 hypothetical protein [Lactobacillus crispatus]MCZ3642640.1 hypothetical protein [Lactobacillus crispatus]
MEDSKDELYVCPGVLFNKHDKKINDFFSKRSWLLVIISLCSGVISGMALPINTQFHGLALLGAWLLEILSWLVWFTTIGKLRPQFFWGHLNPKLCMMHPISELQKLVQEQKVQELRFQKTNKQEKSKLIFLLFLQIAIVLWMSVMNQIDVLMLIGAVGLSGYSLFYLWLRNLFSSIDIEWGKFKKSN